MTDFERDLRARVCGEVHFDAVTRGLYATDASMYQLEPLAVVVPLNEADVIATVRTAAEHSVAIIPRGGGTGLAGQAIGRAVIIDFSKHLNRLLELNVEERWARVEPGLVRDELNALLVPHGLQLAPDPATGNRANVGGMVANNASGTRSLVFGKTIDKLIAARVLLADGSILELGELDPEEYATRAAADSREGEILRGVRAVIEQHRDEIRKRYPKILRRSSGYMLDEFVDAERWNMAKLLCASEGTLGTLLEVTLALDPIPRASGLVVVHFTSLLEAVGSVEPLLQHRPSAVELLDHVLLSLARENLQTSRLCGFLEGDPQAVLAVEFLGQTAAEVAERCRAFAASTRQAGCGYAWPVLLTAAEQAQVWTVRKSGLGLMLGMRGDAKPLAFIEDAAVPVTALADYIEQVLAICARHDTPVTLYAHASVGLLHVRPILNLKSRDDIERMKSIADECFDLVLGYGGSFSGEHGDGLVRSGFIERYFGPRLYAAFGEIKRLFDPRGLMNPGKIVAAPPMEADLRYGPAYRVLPIESFFHFRHDGGLAGAVEMCNGVGACRKTLAGTMCPSYIATRDEEHSTRGRANALRLAMTGRLGPEGFTAEGAREALDLCLSCKGCKAECPSNVDMARLKSEFLQHYHDRHGLSLRDRLIGGSPRLAGLLSGRPAPIANAVARSAPARWALRRIGFDPKRPLPAYAAEPFPRWFARRPGTSAGRRVVLFDDTWMNHHEPRVGRSAVELLESFGYQVTLARAGCCQRPRLSHGLLRDARRDGEATLRRLDSYLQQGLPVLVCEPSCASALTDDLPDLIGDEQLGERVRSGVKMIDLFLAEELAAGRLTGPFTSSVHHILIHGHCHQKALYGTTAMRQLLQGVPGLVVDELDAGCCGMAGSFGHEAEHSGLSERIAAQRLLPAIEQAGPGATVLACGFSCRQQLADLGGIAARHFVELLRGASSPE